MNGDFYERHRAFCDVLAGAVFFGIIIIVGLIEGGGITW